jgi:hypothetical protein
MDRETSLSCASMMCKLASEKVVSISFFLGTDENIFLLRVVSTERKIGNTIRVHPQLSHTKSLLVLLPLRMLKYVTSNEKNPMCLASRGRRRCKP